MNMLKLVSENCEGDERTYIDRECNEMVCSYRILLLAHNASVFDNWVVQKSMDKEIRDINTLRTARGLTS